MSVPALCVQGTNLCSHVRAHRHTQHHRHSGAWADAITWSHLHAALTRSLPGSKVRAGIRHAGRDRNPQAQRGQSEDPAGARPGDQALPSGSKGPWLTGWPVTRTWPAPPQGPKALSLALPPGCGWDLDKTRLGCGDDSGSWHSCDPENSFKCTGALGMALPLGV